MLLTHWRQFRLFTCIISAALLLSGHPRYCSAEGIRTDSRAPYVHIITLFDAQGNKIDYASKFEARPYSPTVTCGKCHNMDVINRGWHFNGMDPQVNPGRPGEPWIYVDPATRTQLPLSYRGWEGTWNPQDVGLDQWHFIQHFGRHLPGGGPGNPKAATPDTGNDEATSAPFTPPQDRWHITGSLEIDCMICHSADRDYNPEYWKTEIQNENYRWAPSAAERLAIIKGTTEKIPQDFDPEFPELTDAPFPTTQYDQNRFDQEGLVFFNIIRQPPNERCYYCHSTNGVDEKLPARYHRDQDVHMAAGMNCSDCHRHGLDHQVMRGYEGEVRPGEDDSAGTLTCQACHTSEHETRDPLKLGGRLGAPIALHEDIPQIHFEKLECTACHSGPWPQSETLAVQTSMAHGLGLSDEHRQPEDPPGIVEPVFRKPANGKIGPYRMMWPAYWGTLENEDIKPALLADVRKTLTPLLKVSGEEKGLYPRDWKPITTEDIQKGLNALQTELPAEQTAVYVTAGKAYKLDGENISAFDNPAAEAYSWPLAHDVRGTGQSLSARECTDCHAADSPFFFGKVATVGPDETPVSQEMITMQGDFGPQYKKTATFFTWMIIGTMAVLLFHIGADLIGNALRKKI